MGEDRSGWLWWLLPVALGFGARLVLAGSMPILFDEAWSIKQASDVSTDMFLGREGDAHPPLSYLVLAGWGALGSGILWFRVLSVALTLAAIYPGALLARRLFGEGAMTPTVWVLALWPLPLLAGWAIRYYALLVLLSTLYLLCWARPLSSNDALPQRPVVVSALEVLLFHTVYTSLPLIVALNGYAVWRLLLVREWRTLAQWVGRSLVVILVCIPQFLVYRRVAPEIAVGIEGYPSLGLVPDLIVAAKAVILTELPYWHDRVLRPLWLLPAFVAMLAGVGLWQKGRVAGPPLVIISLTALLVALGIGSGLRQVGHYYLQVLPLVAVTIGAGLGQLPRHVRIATIAVVASVSLLRLVDPTYHFASANTRAVARVVDQVDQATPVVYLDNMLRAFTDATQFANPRRIAIITDDAALQASAPAVREERWWSSPAVYDRPLLFQPATGVYAEFWSRQRWAATLARAEPAEMYLVVPVNARGTAVVRAPAVERGRRAAESILPAGDSVWQVRELRFAGTLVFHLRRSVP